MSDRVDAAGGVVERDGGVLLVHRPRYDDWTFPKGKLDPGESFEDAALREVEEETGVRCSLGRELPSTEYEVERAPEARALLADDAPGRDRRSSRTTRPTTLRWVTPDEARPLLTYDRDRDLLAAL